MKICHIRKLLNSKDKNQSQKRDSQILTHKEIFIEYIQG